MPYLKSPSPPAARKAVPLIDMTGGIDYSTDAFQVDGKYWLDALNADPAPGGGGMSRRVTNVLHTDTFAAKPMTLGYYERSGGLMPQLLVGFETGELRYITSVEGDLGPSTRIVGPGLTGVRWRGLQVQDNFYLQTATSGPWKWNGSTLSTLATAYNDDTTWAADSAYQNHGMPRGRLMAVLHNRVWLVSGNDKLSWSFPLTNDGGAEDWGAEDFTYVDPGVGGGQITAMIAAGDRLFVFKEHSTWQLLGYSPATFKMFPVTTRSGAAGPDAVCTDGTRVYAYDTQCGLHVITPGDSNTVSSDDGRVFRQMLRVIDDRRVAETGSSDITVGYVGDRVYVSFVIDGLRQTFALDLRLGSWTRYDLQLGPMAHFHPGGRSVPVACSWHPTRPFRVLALNQDGDTDYTGVAEVSFPSWFRTSWIFDDTPTISKHWHYIDFIMDAGDGQSIVPIVSWDWDAGTARNLGVVQADLNSAEDFVMPTSAMVELEYERLSPTAERTPRPWQSAPGADEMHPSHRKTTRRRVRLPGIDSSSLCVTVFGPTPGKRWSVRALVPTYSVSRRPL